MSTSSISPSLEADPAVAAAAASDSPLSVLVDSEWGALRSCGVNCGSSSVDMSMEQWAEAVSPEALAAHTETGPLERSRVMDCAGQFHALLCQHAVSLEFSTPVPSAFCAVYSRDPCFVVGRTLFLSPMRDDYRRPELDGLERLVRRCRRADPESVVDLRTRCHVHGKRLGGKEEVEAGHAADTEATQGATYGRVVSSSPPDAPSGEGHPSASAAAAASAAASPSSSPLAAAPSPSPIIEGGDVLVLRRGLVLVGMGEISNAPGVALLEAELTRRDGPDAWKVVAVPHSALHLDCCLAPLPDGSALVVEAFLPPSSLALLSTLFSSLTPLDPLEAAKELSANLVWLSPTTVCANSRAPKTQALLESRGFTVLVMDCQPLTYSWGSLRCISCPLSRMDAGDAP